MPDPDFRFSLRDRRVLVVEDEYLLANDLCTELEEAGAEVMGPVPTVAEALALLATGAPPDVAILDVNLGGEMVFPVAEVLRDRRIPFMFATGYDAWSLPRAYVDIPRCEKPFDVERCLRTLFE
ncbi:response regulator [Rubellimicrobium arenae]|uniref:response regulator n=1 Tax=Rubellimicrobium arenae TaxID=2817372 RepID=UPI001B30E775|nr:response regulator [Rubellimicrobium arenae]